MRRVDGPVLLLAVLGSGRTTVLVTRLGYMIYCKNIRPQNILTVTYTVAATKDMKARFVRFFGEEHADSLTFRTINGLCAVAINYYAKVKGSRPFAMADDEGRLNAVVRELLSKGGGYSPDQQVKEARTHITYCKNMMFSDGDVESHQVDGMDFPSVYKGYQAFLLKNRLMDFDGQTTLFTTVLIWPEASFQVLSTTSATPEPPAGAQHRAHSSRARSIG